ncbi:hypothetical protein EXIGLDRAFT_420398 [Exidia glandulosa HHB12029]|uniref:F-box domain-containing protein n=1 Tax=Exidia glandulosa HHB12029 TaxID=1314781 RepID=A0A165KLL3_EXIGL|nr:hypothetical protein EXIGLDRAFT_420398 [Exidia glandulosa HHB12029]
MLNLLIYRHAALDVDLVPLCRQGCLYPDPQRRELGGAGGNCLDPSIRRRRQSAMPSSLFSLCRGLCSLFFGASNSKPLRSLSGSPSYFPTTLPPETWAAVAAHLFEAEDIVSLACTSSSLCVIAERKLYRRVWLWDPLSLSRFVHALRHRPERALYVHTFRFAVDPAAGTPIDVQDTAEANLAYVLRTCSRLRGLELPEWTLRVPVDVVTEVGLSLKSLEILSEESTDSWLAPLLRSQPRLLRLRVWGALALPATDDAQQLCASLSTIAMNAQSLPLMVTGRPVERVEVLGVCNVQEVIAAILRSTKTVKSLTLRPDTPPEDFLPVLRDNLPDLEELIVTGVRSTYFDQVRRGLSPSSCSLIRSVVAGERSGKVPEVAAAASARSMLGLWDCRGNTDLWRY